MVQSNFFHLNDSFKIIDSTAIISDSAFTCLLLVVFFIMIVSYSGFFSFAMDNPFPLKS